jgi:hypothetical protein
MFWNIFRAKTEADMIEKYLADSISLEDLERRQKLVYSGKAPFQNNAKTFIYDPNYI